jgi:hypothetical protein
MDHSHTILLRPSCIVFLSFHLICPCYSFAANPPPTCKAQVYIYIPQEQDGPVQTQSRITTDGQSISMSWCLVRASLEGLHLNEFQSDIRRGPLRRNY